MDIVRTWLVCKLSNTPMAYQIFFKVYETSDGKYFSKANSDRGGYLRISEESFKYYQDIYTKETK